MIPLASFANIISKPLVGKTIAPLTTSTIVRQQQSNEITESSILNSFPRPNLQPTLSFKSGLKASTCFNCNGPHSTEFCPC